MNDIRPTDPLRNEHAEVLLKLEALQRMTQQPDARAETLAELRQLGAFFQTDFWVHFAKEEEALFPEMEKYSPRDRGPLGVMLAEHEELRDTNNRMQAAFSGFLADTGNAQHQQSMKEHGGHFVGMLRDHIHKEDNILFVMAEQWLDQAQKQQVEKLCRDIETREKVGAAKG